MSIYGKAILESNNKEVLNEGKIKDFIDKQKKKKLEKYGRKLDYLKNKNIKKFTPEQEADIKAEFKLVCDKVEKLVNKYNKDSKIKKEIRKQLDEMIEYSAYELDGYDKDSGVPELEYNLERFGKRIENGEEECYIGYFQLYNGSQTVSYIFCDVVLPKIVEELNKDKDLKLCEFLSLDDIAVIQVGFFMN